MNVYLGGRVDEITLRWVKVGSTPAEDAEMIFSSLSLRPICLWPILDRTAEAL